MNQNELMHHGIKGQKWGVRNGPPYPLEDNDSLYSKGKSFAENTILYHGSKNKIVGELNPRFSFLPDEPLVYATDDYAYALLRSGNFDMNKLLVREDYYDGKISLAELKPGAFKELFDRPGYIYSLDNSNFKWNITQPAYNEYISNKNAKIKDVVKIDNIWNEMQKYKDRYDLVTYENPGNYWDNVRGGKEGYIARKKAILKALNEALEMKVEDIKE